MRDAAPTGHQSFARVQTKELIPLLRRQPTKNTRQFPCPKTLNLNAPTMAGGEEVAGAIAVGGQAEVLKGGLVGQVGPGVAVEARAGAEILKEVLGSQRVSQMVFMMASQTEGIAGVVDISFQAQVVIPRSLAIMGAGAIVIAGQAEVLKGDPVGQVGLRVAVEAGEGGEVIKEAMVSRVAST